MGGHVGWMRITLRQLIGLATTVRNTTMGIREGEDNGSIYNKSCPLLYRLGSISCKVHGLVSKADSMCLVSFDYIGVKRALAI